MTTLHKLVATAALLVPLGGCVVAPSDRNPAAACNDAPPHPPGYLPAYPPFEQPRSQTEREWLTDTQPQRSRVWVKDTPHWQPGDE